MRVRLGQAIAISVGLVASATIVATGGFWALAGADSPPDADTPVQSATSPAATANQVSGLAAVHRGGQTFLTWQEIGDPPPGELTMKALQDLDRALREKRKYRIYRSNQPIERVSGAVLLGEQAPLSAWNGAHYGRNPNPEAPALRFVIQDGGQPLASGTGLLVHQPETPGPAYYAVTVVEAGKENPILTAANRTGPVTETAGQGTPVLQRTAKPESFQFINGATLNFYVRWEPRGNANPPGQPFDYVVAIPPDVKQPAPVGVHLHEWGGSLYGSYGWWFNAEKGAVLVASNQQPYDWWTGYHEQYYGPQPNNNSGWTSGVVRPYSQTRLLSFVDWLGTRLSLDRSRMFVAGSSMGGSGAVMLAIRRPELFAWAMGWSGVHVPRDSPQFKSSYEGVWGRPEWNVKFEDGTPVWDYYDDTQYLRNHRASDVGFITFSNGKNDHAIGWPQAVQFARALQETRQPHLFVWASDGHNARGQMPEGGQRVNPLDLRTDQSLPAFTRGSLDDDPGDGTESSGEATGQFNAFLTWAPGTIRDEKDQWAITLRLTDGAKVPVATADVTPRRLQRFKVRPGDRAQWTNVVGGQVIQKGDVVADQWGLITLPQVQIARGSSRVTVSLSAERQSP